MPGNNRKKLLVLEIFLNNIRDFIPTTVKAYFSMSSTISLIPHKKISLIPNSVNVNLY